MVGYQILGGVRGWCATVLVLRGGRGQVHGDALCPQCIGKDDLRESARLGHGVRKQNWRLVGRKGAEIVTVCAPSGSVTSDDHVMLGRAPAGPVVDLLT